MGPTELWASTIVINFSQSNVPAPLLLYLLYPPPLLFVVSPLLLLCLALWPFLSLLAMRSEEVDGLETSLSRTLSPNYHIIIYNYNMCPAKILKDSIVSLFFYCPLETSFYLSSKVPHPAHGFSVS